MNPYHEYIDLAELTELWSADAADPALPATVGCLATEELEASVAKDQRAHFSADEASWRLQRSIADQQALLARLSTGHGDDRDNRHAICRRVRDLHSRHRHGPEDLLFAGVHQVCEAWCATALRLTQEPWQDDSTLFIVADVLRMLTQLMDILDLMVAEEYHPLRVALRGSSGAQSAAMLALSSRVAQLLRSAPAELEQRLGVPLEAVTMSPETYASTYRTLQALTAVDAAHRALFYGHYLRALIIQGSHGFGALGEGTEILKARFMPNPGLVLDDVRTHHLSWHNMRHAARQGCLVLAFEQKSGCHDESVTEPQQELDGAANSELIGMLLSDVAAEDLAARTGPECVVRLLGLSRPYRGRTEVRKLIDEIRQWLRRCSGELRVSHVGPTSCEVRYAFTSRGGETVRGQVSVTGARDQDGTVTSIDIVAVPT